MRRVSCLVAVEQQIAGQSMHKGYADRVGMSSLYGGKSGCQGAEIAPPNRYPGGEACSVLKTGELE